MKASTLGEFMDTVESRLREVMRDKVASKISFALFPFVLRLGQPNFVDNPEDETREDTLSYAVLFLLDEIAELKGQERLYSGDDV